MDIHVDHKDRATAFYGQPTTPDTLLSRTQIQAVDFLERCAHDLEPLAAVTGASGTGKTVALNIALARRESAGDRVIRVNNFVAGPLSLHRVLASSLGVEEAAELSAEELEPVLRKALSDGGQAEPPVLAVDDAQSLLPETLRYLCLLAGLREAGRPLFRILLVGRPGFTVRQPIPLQFTLESMRPEAAREIVEHGLAVAGVTAVDEVVQGLVQHAQGNLRKLDLLLRDSIQEAQKGGLKPGSRRRVTVEGVQIAAGARPRGRPVRTPAARSWLVVPALAALAVAGGGIAYHNGWFASPVVAPGAAPPPPATVPPATAPPAIPAPSTSTELSAQLVARPSPPAPGAGVTLSSLPPVAVLAKTPDPGKPQGGTAPAAPSPVVAAPTEPAPAASSDQPPANAALVPEPRPQPPVQRPRAGEGQPLSAPAQGAAGESGRFRVYNIGACHHSVCPRWSVTDLDREQRFVAGFDPASLHLDRETMQRVREGGLDLIVKGAVTRNGSEAPTLSATTLEAMAPHHGRPRIASPQLQDPGAASPTQSPPPGFLSLPSDNSPFAPAGSAPDQQGGPYQQGGQY